MKNVNNPELSIIFPTYNERENIIDIIGEARLYISTHIGANHEFIVVDDDSPDKTWEIVQKHFSGDNSIKLIRRTNQKGLASAIRSGINASEGSIVAWMDCDFSHPPYILAELVNKIYEGYDISVGSRFTKGGRDVRGPADSWIAVILSRAMNYFISFVLGWSFKDYTSGFVAVRRKVFDNIEINGDYGEYFIGFIHKARRKGYKIIEIPYYCIPRRKGVSKTGTNFKEYLEKGWKYILYTLDLKLKIR
ncbi:MAG: glycosyltransferase [Candidatus Omnitrophota bacterium]